VQVSRQSHFLCREVFGLALVLSFELMPVRQTSQVNPRSQILLLIGIFSQHRFLAAHLQIALSTCDCNDIVMRVDKNGIQHYCEELVHEFEKFAVMAMNPGANLDSLPILDNPDNFVVHAHAAFILEISYVAINNLIQLNSSRSYSTCSIQSNTCSSLVCKFFCSTIYLVSQITSLPGV